MARHFGADGVIPKTLPGSPDAIVAELNAYRAAAPSQGERSGTRDRLAR